MLAQNFRTRHGELDLVMLDGATVAVVEVRKRSHGGYGGAAASVDRRKRHKLCVAAEAWRVSNPVHAQRALRFDVIALDATNQVEWVKAAFDAGD